MIFVGLKKPNLFHRQDSWVWKGDSSLPALLIAVKTSEPCLLWIWNKSCWFLKSVMVWLTKDWLARATTWTFQDVNSKVHRSRLDMKILHKMYWNVLQVKTVLQLKVSTCLLPLSFKSWQLIDRHLAIIFATFCCNNQVESLGQASSMVPVPMGKHHSIHLFRNLIKCSQVHTLKGHNVIFCPKFAKSNYFMETSLNFAPNLSPLYDMPKSTGPKKINTWKLYNSVKARI